MVTTGAGKTGGETTGAGGGTPEMPRPAGTADATTGTPERIEAVVTGDTIKPETVTNAVAPAREANTRAAPIASLI